MAAKTELNNYWSATFAVKGKVSFITGGQWGSEGKGAAAAWLAKQVYEIGKGWDIITTNAGAQAGHTSIHNGVKVVVNHLPTASIIANTYGHRPTTYLNAGCIIDPERLLEELRENPGLNVVIHPNAAVIDDFCKEAEGLEHSYQTRIGSTRKGVGQALSRKVMRIPTQIAREHPDLKYLVGVIDLNHNAQQGSRILCEVPQGYSLGINTQFYPHTTSRSCTVMQAMADMDLHPAFYGNTMMVLRSLPIRVGNITDGAGNEIGNSGGYYSDQKELSWEQLGLTPEITTVTKRVRRVFTFSERQVMESMAATRPHAIFMTFCDYLGPARAEHWHQQLVRIAYNLGFEFIPVFGVGPTTDDVLLSLHAWRR
jgi:adenylosuccinate synthase